MEALKFRRYPAPRELPTLLRPVLELRKRARPTSLSVAVAALSILLYLTRALSRRRHLTTLPPRTGIRQARGGELESGGDVSLIRVTT